MTEQRECTIYYDDPAVDASDTSADQTQSEDGQSSSDLDPLQQSSPPAVQHDPSIGKPSGSPPPACPLPPMASRPQSENADYWLPSHAPRTSQQATELQSRPLPPTPTEYGNGYGPISALKSTTYGGGYGPCLVPSGPCYADYEEPPAVLSSENIFPQFDQPTEYDLSHPVPPAQGYSTEYEQSIENDEAPPVPLARCYSIDTDWPPPVPSARYNCTDNDRPLPVPPKQCDVAHELFSEYGPPPVPSRNTQHALPSAPFTATPFTATPFTTNYQPMPVPSDTIKPGSESLLSYPRLGRSPHQSLLSLQKATNSGCATVEKPTTQQLPLRSAPPSPPPCMPMMSPLATQPRSSPMPRARCPSPQTTLAPRQYRPADDTACADVDYELGYEEIASGGNQLPCEDINKLAERLQQRPIRPPLTRQPQVAMKSPWIGCHNTSRQESTCSSVKHYQLGASFCLTNEMLEPLPKGVEYPDKCAWEAMHHVYERSTDADDGGAFERDGMPSNVDRFDNPIGTSIHRDDRVIIKGKVLPLRPRKVFTKDSWHSMFSVADDNGKNIYVRLAEGMFGEDVVLGDALYLEEPSLLSQLTSFCHDQSVDLVGTDKGVVSPYRQGMFTPLTTAVDCKGLTALKKINDCCKKPRAAKVMGTKYAKPPFLTSFIPFYRPGKVPVVKTRCVKSQQCCTRQYQAFARPLSIRVYTR